MAIPTTHVHYVLCHNEIYYLYRFQLVDFGLAHLEPKYRQSKEEQKGGNGCTLLLNIHVDNALMFCYCISGNNHTRLRSRTFNESTLKLHVATSGINGIVASSQTYQRQVHHRTTARSLRQSTSVRSRTTTIADGGGGAQGRQATESKKNKSIKQEEEIRVCPLRHTETEVCNSCMARYVLIRIIL